MRNTAFVTVLAALSISPVFAQKTADGPPPCVFVNGVPYCAPIFDDSKKKPAPKPAVAEVAKTAPADVPWPRCGVPEPPPDPDKCLAQ